MIHSTNVSRRRRSGFSRTVLPAALFALLLGSACGQRPTQMAYVAQAWQSSGATYANTDSLAACAVPGQGVLVFATSKEGHRLDIFEAATGAFVQAVGTEGAALGEFRRPNGIAAIDFPAEVTGGDASARRPLILVVERDNHRVQMLWADTLAPAGVFGERRLRRPYGVAMSRRTDGIYAYITDTTVPPDQTVQVYRLLPDGADVRAEHVHAFGASAGDGRIQLAESIVVDDGRDRVLLCDEQARDVKVYTRDGRFTGRRFGKGLVVGDPEGIVVAEDSERARIILTDQRETITIWHMFSADDLGYQLSWTGRPNVANTDGICIYEEPFPGFPGGALFAVHDDADVRAYPLADILALPGNDR